MQVELPRIGVWVGPRTFGNGATCESPSVFHNPNLNPKSYKCQANPKLYKPCMPHTFLCHANTFRNSNDDKVGAGVDLAFHVSSWWALVLRDLALGQALHPKSLP